MPAKVDCYRHLVSEMFPTLDAHISIIMLARSNPRHRIVGIEITKKAR